LANQFVGHESMKSARLDFPLKLSIPGGRGASAALHLQLREAILEGRLATGFRLPPTRELAQMLGVARTTVVNAYETLVAEGYARVRQGDGTFVQALRRSVVAAGSKSRLAAPALVPAERAASPPRFDLRLGSPDISSFPFDVWRRLAAKGWRSSAGQAYEASDPAGFAPLREAIVALASASRAVSCTPDDVVVVAGAQQAFDLLARTLVRPGTVVAVEDPGYRPARLAFAAAGAQMVGVPVDEEGIVVERIPKTARLICVTPSHQFPLGVTLSPARRLALLEFARRYGAMLIEDDYDGEYRYDKRPLDALQTLAPGRVCYVGTFSKTLFPALRLGYAILPQGVRARLLKLRSLADGFGAPAPQWALAAFIREGHLQRHVRRMQRLYAHRRDQLLVGLSEGLGERIRLLPSSAGLHFSFRVLGPVDWPRAMARAAELEMAFEPCSRYAIRSRSDDCCAIGFGLLQDEQIAPVIEGLKTVLRRPR
jgi:GntR family transcriptional regulator/MocR family aminotransferase